ncbi:MAG: hypothetical protein LQ339_002207 [Xanthoria mediterranea]|nr:MAG: hypothetical protein LQ339_002207 [Xanthoria mediterranea]
MSHTHNAAVVRRSQPKPAVGMKTDEHENLISQHKDLTQELYNQLRHPGIIDLDCRQQLNDLKIQYKRLLLDLEKERSQKQELEKRIEDLESSWVNCPGGAKVRGRTHRRGPLQGLRLMSSSSLNYTNPVLAADELLARIREHLDTRVVDPDQTDIVVRAYANLSGLGTACWREMRADRPDMRSFAGEFSARNPLFDFVDVGVGRERADEKIISSMEFYLQNVQWEHIFLAVCHDQGYIPFLEQLAEDERVRDGVTLIYGARVARRYRTLDLDLRIELPTVFSPNEGTLLWSIAKDVLHQKGKTQSKKRSGGSAKSTRGLVYKIRRR